MARGRDERRWRHTSAVLALTANCHRNPKRRGSPYDPAEFDPYLDYKPKPLRTLNPHASIALLKSVFLPKGK